MFTSGGLVMKPVRILVSILCVCFVSAALGEQPAGKGQNNWSEFHRPDMTRWNPYERVINVHNVGSLRLKWRYKTVGNVDSSPAVVNGVVYVGGGEDVYALKASTGALL